MLSTPDYDEAVASFVRDTVNELMRATNPVFASLRRRVLPEGVEAIRVETGTGSVESPMVHMQELIAISPPDIVAGNLEEFHATLAQIADAHLEQFMRPFYAYIENAASSVGNTIELSKETLSWDSVIEGYDKVEWAVDDNGQVRPPQIHAGKNVAATLNAVPDLTAEQHARIAAIAARKQEEHVLAEAVAAYVESLTERDLDAPLIALLQHHGFERVHLVHGAYEFGKDIIAQREEGGISYQYCLQSKAGDLGVGDWRAVRLQVDAMRSGTVVHPDFDPAIDRRLVVVTNGRLKGGAGVEFQDYNTYHSGRGEMPVELWDIDYLVPLFEEVLVEGVPALDRARTLELMGRLGQSEGSRGELRSFARPWFDAGLSKKQRWSHVLNAAMLAREASVNGREDLASQLAFLVLRVARENPSTPHDPDEAELLAARSIFRAYAAAFWGQVKTADAVELTTSSSDGLSPFVTHPVRSARLCECLSLLGLDKALAGDADGAREIADYIVDFLGRSPGVTHIVSDEWAFSLLVTTLLLLLTDHQSAAHDALRESAVWLLDKIEYGRGVAQVQASATEAVAQLLGPPYPHLHLAHEPATYAFAVILDLAYIAGFAELFGDLLNDLEALGAMASIVAQRASDNVELIARIAYSATDESPALHHDIPIESLPAASAGDYFDCLATWATQRDRHLPAVLKLLAPQP